MKATELQARLTAATQAGIITSAQAEALLPVLQNEPPRSDSFDPPLQSASAKIVTDELTSDAGFYQEEPLKFLNNLGDWFIAVGIVFITVTLLIIMPLGWINLLSIAGYIVLSEWLVKSRRMLLPGMVIVISILCFIDKLLPYGSVFSDAFLDANLTRSSRGLQYSLLAGVVASATYFWRYRLPFSVAVAVFLSLTWLLLMLSPANLALNIWACGFVVFLLAMLFDSQDTERKTYLSDAGFWLHSLAAPMLTHGFSAYLISNNVINDGVMQLVEMGFYAVLILVSLLVDRRAILLASITYFILLLTGLIGGGMSAFKPTVALLLIGVSIVLMGGFWYPLRRALFGRLANTAIGRWVPPF